MAEAAAAVPAGAAAPRPARPEWEASPAAVGYPEALARMEARVEAVRDRGAPGLAWLLEHPALYTAGTSAVPSELLAPGGLPVFQAGRGGRWTYHGPGQRVAYLVIDLKPYGCDLRGHVRRLEAWAIAALAELGVRGERRDDRIGVWVTGEGGRESKVAAIGVRVRRWVAWHGMALNVAPDLARFDGIVPCGLRGHGVTSLAALGVPAGVAEVDAALARNFDAAFGPF